MWCKSEFSRCCPSAVVFAVGSLAIALLAGCGGGDQGLDSTLSDTGVISSLVVAVSQTVTAGEPDRFEVLFPEGAAPSVSERSKYGEPLVFVLVGAPEISGDTATFTVNMLREDPVTEEREEIKELKWTGVKTAGGWKLKDVPLD